MTSRKFPLALAVFLVAIAVVNALAGEFSWYWTMRWFDMPMHFAGGAWVAGVVIWWKLFSERSVVSRPEFLNLVLWGVDGALLIGFGWEVYESAIAFFVEGHINDIMDTISDLVFDALGGFAIACIVWLFYKMKS